MSEWVDEWFRVFQVVLWLVTGDSGGSRFLGGSDWFRLVTSFTNSHSQVSWVCLYALCVPFVHATVSRSPLKCACVEIPMI